MRKILFIFILIFIFILGACGNETPANEKGNIEQDPEKILSEIRERDKAENEKNQNENKKNVENNGKLKENTSNIEDKEQAVPEKKETDNVENNDIENKKKENVNSPNEKETEQAKTQENIIPSQKPETENSSSKPDIDLTVLSSTVMYSELYNILTQPDLYEGKIIKIRGQFSAMEDPQTGKKYFACGISDVGGCCQIGLEFVTLNEMAYPDDYPTLGSIVTVQGRFNAYVEEGIGYRTLLDATMTKE